MTLYRLVIQAMAWVAALVLGAMAFAVTFDVMARNLGVRHTGWIMELSEYSLPLATLLIAPWLLHRGEHVRLDVLLTMFPRTLSGALDRVANLLGIGICLVFVWYGSRLILDSARLGSMMVKTLSIPEWWQYALVPVCFFLMAVEFVRRLRA